MVSNKLFGTKANQTYIVKFTSSKAPIYPFTIIQVDQILAIDETIKFLACISIVTYHGRVT